MRVPIIAGNWKMNKTPEEAAALCRELLPLLGGLSDREVVLCPPFTSLAVVKEAIEGTDIALGAQNVFYEDSGAYTGEVSPPMLKALGVKYVIIGHSERREYFGETDETVNRKVKAALAHGLRPILCVGETLEQREAGVTETLVKSQIRKAFADVSADDAVSVVVAYEPIWAIGTGKTATAQEANRVIGLIRATLGEIYGGSTAEVIRIQYGGSVKPENMAELMQEPEIDGALVGGASLDAPSFARIVRYDEQG
ncbi:MAG TPA: triose-phosphate isomerase [Firmicutes bacterium]|nr:triose-phosphate isomerase [Bacillota bacterium]